MWKTESGGQQRFEIHHENVNNIWIGFAFLWNVSVCMSTLAQRHPYNDKHGIYLGTLKSATVYIYTPVDITRNTDRVIQKREEKGNGAP